MTTVDVVVPSWIDDPERPSGGNTYDRKVCEGLATVGWDLRLHRVQGAWPRPEPDDLRGLAKILAAVPDGGLVVLDGLVASVAASVLVPESSRLREVIVVHLPLGAPVTGDHPAAAARHPARTLVAEREVLSTATAVVTSSLWTRRWLLERYGLAPSRVHVAEPGVEPAAAAPGSPDGGELLCVGAVARHKGHDLLLAALAAVRDLPWHCTCVGSLDVDPPFADSVRREARACGLGDRLVFAGALGGSDLLEAYDTADLLVLSSRMETYGMVATEALGRGLPVVAPAVGGIPEAIGSSADGTRPALLVAPHDPAALATALRCWLEDATVRQRLRRAAHERRSSLPTWTQTTAEVSRVLVKASR